MRTASVIASFAVAILASPALACSPAPLDVGQRLQNAECADVYNDDAYTSRGVGGARDMGGGFVRQFFVAGNACYNQASMIVTDCNTGRAVIFGPGDPESLMASEEERARQAKQPFQVLRAAIEAAAAAGTPMTLQAIADRAGDSFTNNAIVGTGNPVGISSSTEKPRHGFDLSCGCKLYYPGLPGN